MKRRNVYTVRYFRNGIWEKPELVDVIATSKEDAYYTASSKLHDSGIHPYGMYVSSVTYQNGNFREFNTFCGKPY